MSTSPIISSSELQALLASSKPVMIFDCSYELMQPSAGKAAYQKAHIPGAVFADIGKDLSAPHGQGVSGGRHPLPTREHFAQWLESAGFQNQMRAVVYDRNKQNFCVRLWWMLRWLGHDAVSVLDGGLQAWETAGGAIETGDSPTANATGAPFAIHASLMPLVDAAHIHARLDSNQQQLIDARGPERYRGDVEPLDAVAGHIPGAFNRPFSANFDANGQFKTPEQLRAEFNDLLGTANTDAEAQVIHYCGSGVSATPNVLAMTLAGFPTPSLYAGSWSDWSAQPELPKAQAKTQQP